MIEPDDLLLERLSGGETNAFETLFLRHYDRVCRVVYGLVRSREAAEDLAQETFVELYRRPPRSEAENSLASWLCRVALNKGYNALRSESREKQRAELEPRPDHSVDPYSVLLRSEENATVRRVLAHLSERQSKLLLLRYAGLSYAEIAEALDVAPGSVGTLLVRAEKAFLAAYKLMQPLEYIDSTEKRER
jgi:RNA polymerase sigma-70 factor (ECF subfamily)